MMLRRIVPQICINIVMKRGYKSEKQIVLLVRNEVQIQKNLSSITNIVNKWFGLHNKCYGRIGSIKVDKMEIKEDGMLLSLCAANSIIQVSKDVLDPMLFDRTTFRANFQKDMVFSIQAMNYYESTAFREEINERIKDVDDVLYKAKNADAHLICYDKNFKNELNNLFSSERVQRIINALCLEMTTTELVNIDKDVCAYSDTLESQCKY